MLALNLAIPAADHDLALIAALRVASGRINGVILIVIIPRGPLIAAAFYVPSAIAVGGYVVDASVAHRSMWVCAEENKVKIRREGPSGPSLGCNYHNDTLIGVIRKAKS